MDSKQLRTFSDGVREMYTAPNVETLSRRALRLLTALIPGETAVFGERTARCTGGPFRSDAFILHGSDAYVKNEQAYRAFLSEHPLEKRCAFSRDLPATTFDRLMPPDQWHRTGLYNEFFRPLRLENILCFTFEPRTMPYVAVGIARSMRGFSSREHVLLNLIRPHIASAYDLVNELHGPPSDTTVNGLTPRENEVLHWVSQGKTNTEIAVILGAARLTVKKHVENILRKLSVETRTAAAVRAIELGLSNPAGDAPATQTTAASH